MHLEILGEQNTVCQRYNEAAGVHSVDAHFFITIIVGSSFM